MYGSCGEILYSRKVFDEMPYKTMVSWNSMLVGYAKCGDLKRAREVFESMLDKDVVLGALSLMGMSREVSIEKRLQCSRGWRLRGGLRLMR